MVFAGCVKNTGPSAENHKDTLSYQLLAGEIITTNKIISPGWTSKLKLATECRFDSLSTFEISGEWKVNDSINALIIRNYSPGYVLPIYEYLLTFHKKEHLIDLFLVKEDIGFCGQSYSYFDYMLLDDHQISLRNHGVRPLPNPPGFEGSRNDSVFSKTILYIADNGLIEQKENVD
ncbi:MAG: hypothetical protein ACJ77K_03125 [Bacteroidia bacterium]